MLKFKMVCRALGELEEGRESMAMMEEGLGEVPGLLEHLQEVHWRDCSALQLRAY